MTQKINLPCDGVGESVSHAYDASPTPGGGYAFEYSKDTSLKPGKGSGTIRND